MYIKIILHTYLYYFNLPLNVYFIMFLNSQKSLVDLHTLMRSFSKLIYERILVNFSMIDLGRHMWDHYLACSFIFLNVYYIYEIMIVYEWQEDFEARLSQVRSDVASNVSESQITPLDPAEEHRLRTHCWVHDQSVRDDFMILEIFLIVINVEMTASCSICKDLAVALKIQRRLID